MSGIFAGIGCAPLCAVVQYATGAPVLSINVDSYLPAKYRIPSLSVGGSIALAGIDNSIAYMHLVITNPAYVEAM
jgi:hypothetical protein